jgi:hypothetical protein
VEKYCRAGQDTNDNMAHAHCMLDPKVDKHTLTICDTLYFSTAAMVVHALLDVTLYVHCLSYYTISLSCLRSSNEPRRKGKFSCVYQFNLSITLRLLPNSMVQNTIRKPSSLTVGQEIQPPFMQTESSCRFHKSPQLVPIFRCINPALCFSRTCVESVRRFQAGCVRWLRRVLQTECR